MNQTFLFLLFALLAAGLDNLGQGFQKGGSRWFETGPKGLLKGQGRAPFLLWVTGIVMCIAAPFVLALSLTRGPATLAAALGVFGLVPLYLYAGLVLGETITKAHRSALFLIVIGTMWIGWKSIGLEFQDSQFQPERLGLILAIGLGGSGLWSLVAVWRRSPFQGFALGTLSGIIGGLNLLVIKWGALLNAWWATGAVWIALSTAAFFVLQLAYARSTALQVVPSNTAVAVLFPMIVSPIIFAEPMPGWLISGVIPSFGAIFLLAYGERQSAEVEGSIREEQEGMESEEVAS